MFSLQNKFQLFNNKRCHYLSEHNLAIFSDNVIVISDQLWYCNTSSSLLTRLSTVTWFWSTSLHQVINVIVKLWYGNTTSSLRWLPLGRSIMSLHMFEHPEPLQAGHVGHTRDKCSDSRHIPVWGGSTGTSLVPGSMSMLVLYRTSTLREERRIWWI